MRKDLIQKILWGLIAAAGRSILDNHLVHIPSAIDVLPDKFTEFERVFFTGASSFP